jgi:hypothetical protein
VLGIANAAGHMTRRHMLRGRLNVACLIVKEKVGFKLF